MNLVLRCMPLLPTLLAVLNQLPAQSTWARIYDPQNPATVIAVVDPITGTWWSDRSACDFPRPTGGTGCPMWEQAIAYGDVLTTGGYTDWRVPSKDEFLKAVADGGHAALLAAFPNSTWTASFWTSTTKGRDYAWMANWTNGWSGVLTKTSTGPVNCCRGPVYQPPRGGNRIQPGTGPTCWQSGFPSPGCANAPTLTPALGPAGSTAVLAEDAPPHAPGLLLLSPALAPRPLAVANVVLFLLPSTSVPVAVQADDHGRASFALTWPTGSKAAEVCLQVFWHDAACAVRPLSASAVLGLATP
jgi:hypothetical protein